LRAIVAEPVAGFEGILFTAFSAFIEIKLFALTVKAKFW
jgi:hypothetical protein